MWKTTALAIALAFIAPLAVKAETVETEGYGDYQVSCEAATCGNFDVSFEQEGDQVAQTRRTRTRRTSSTGNRLFKDYYVGGSAGIILTGDGLDLGFQGSVFGGTKYNEYIGGDVEFTFGFAGLENFDDTLTLLGVYLNPRFEYQFDGSDITAFVSPGLGFIRASGTGDSDTEFDFQIKAGASKPINEKLDVFAQGRYQNEAELLSIEGGVIYDIQK
jgi:hypothetical protein